MKKKLSDNSIDSCLIGEILDDDSLAKSNMNLSEAKESLLSKYTETN